MTLQFDAAPDELAVFLEEAEEQLQLLDQDILILEREGTNQTVLQEVFRAAHTLKGSSAAIGHERMASLTHAMESLLDCLRKGEMDTSTALIDLLLQSLDVLRILKEEVVTLEHSGLDPSALVQSLIQFRQDRMPGKSQPSAPSSGEVGTNGSGDGPKEEVPVAQAGPKPSTASPADNSKLYRIAVQVPQGSLFPAARFLQVHIALAGIGTVVLSNPSKEDIEAEKVGTELHILYSSAEDRKWIEDLLRNIPEVIGVQVDEMRQGPDIPQETSPDAAAEAVAPAASAPADERPATPVAPVAQTGPERTEERRTAAAPANTAKTVRIDVERLDSLMNLVGELVIGCTREVQLGARLQARYEGDELAQGVSETSLQIQRITDELQDLVMKARMFPVGSVFNRFPRMIRDLAQKANKKVQFTMAGEETELDRSVIETISDPLIHLLRNAVDHGIESPQERLAAGKPETGHISLSACHRESRILLTVEDDGKGIDPKKMRKVAVERGLMSAEAAERLSDREAVEIIFAPGFSTAAKVTDVSGRGVGMDVVRTNIHRLNGQVNIESAPGKGSVITVELPLTLAIMDALLVGMHGSTFAIPLASVIETLRVPREQLYSINTNKVIQLRGNVLPLITMDKLLGSKRNSLAATSIFVVVVGTGNEQVGMVVDSLIGEQQVVIKALGGFIGDVRGLSGATILGDGTVALILDIPALVKRTIRERAGEVIYA